jgi:F-type H+-transporting ATPase subunit epsilon
MSKTIKVKIVTPNSILFNAKTSMVIIPGEFGEFGVLPNHQLLIANLQAGMIRISMGGAIIKYFVDGGIAEVTGKRVNIVTEFAIEATNFHSQEIIEKIATLNAAIKTEMIITKIDIIKLAITRHESLLNCLASDNRS